MAVLMFATWLIVLQFNVGIKSIENNVQCDRPLAPYLVVSGCVTLFSVVLQLILLLWYCVVLSLCFGDLAPHVSIRLQGHAAAVP